MNEEGSVQWKTISAMWEFEFSYQVLRKIKYTLCLSKQKYVQLNYYFIFLIKIFLLFKHYLFYNCCGFNPKWFIPPPKKIIMFDFLVIFDILSNVYILLFILIFLNECQHFKTYLTYLLRNLYEGSAGIRPLIPSHLLAKLVFAHKSMYLKIPKNLHVKLNKLHIFF